MEHNANAVAAGRVAGIDPVEEVKKRCVRIVGVLEPEVGGCVLCRFSLRLFFFSQKQCFKLQGITVSFHLTFVSLKGLG